MKRIFVESDGFAAERDALCKSGEITIEDLMTVELEIMINPDPGDVVPGTGGLRKIRMSQKGLGRGKRGGCRVLFLDLSHIGLTHLLAIFGKREKIDLSTRERKSLAGLVRILKTEASYEKRKTIRR